MTAAIYEVLNTDLRTGTVIDRIPVAGISYTETLNQSGTAQIRMPLNAPQADPDRLFAGGSGLVVVRDGEPVWGGILWALSADLAAGTLSLNASGYHSHYKGRHFSDGMVVNEMDIADCLKLFLNVPDAVNTDFSALVRTDRKRTRSWTKSEFKNIAEAVEDMADDIGGFNFRYVSYWIERGKKVGNRFQISDRNGRDIGRVLEHRVNCNVSSVSYDSTSLATTAAALGADNGAGEKLVGFATNTALAERIPQKRIVESYSDVKETETLIRKAQAIVNAGAAPVAIPSVTLYPEWKPADFAPGDYCSVQVDSGYVRVLDDFVVTERATTVDTNGRESITLTLANRGIFSNAVPS